MKALICQFPFFVELVCCSWSVTAAVVGNWTTPQRNTNNDWKRRNQAKPNKNLHQVPSVGSTLWYLVSSGLSMSSRQHRVTWADQDTKGTARYKVTPQCCVHPLEQAARLSAQSRRYCIFLEAAKMTFVLNSLTTYRPPHPPSSPPCTPFPTVPFLYHLHKAQEARGCLMELCNCTWTWTWTWTTQSTAHVQTKNRQRFESLWTRTLLDVIITSTMDKQEERTLTNEDSH